MYQSNIISRLRLAACILPLAAFVSVGFTQAANSQTLYLQTDSISGCLDVDFSSPAGNDGAGRNVILWQNCHGGGNQSWEHINGSLTAFIDGKQYCLDVDMQATAGLNGAGRNVIAWPNCHGENNQYWYIHSDGEIRSAANNWCLDVNQDAEAGQDGAGRNVIVWPNCHKEVNQQWFVNSDGIY